MTKQITQPYAPITEAELAALIDGVGTDNLAELQELMSDRHRYDSKTFQREASNYISEALDKLGFCWIRSPARNDPLFDDIIAALYRAGQVERIAFTSHNEHVRKSAAKIIASKMLQQWHESNTQVVRRPPE